MTSRDSAALSGHRAVLGRDTDMKEQDAAGVNRMPRASDRHVPIAWKKVVALGKKWSFLGKNGYYVHTMPLSVTSVAVFCDESLFSVPPDSAGLVSIAVQGYVQASHVKPPSTMENWINSATWEPVPGGLTV